MESESSSLLGNRPSKDNQNRPSDSGQTEPLSSWICLIAAFISNVLTALSVNTFPVLYTPLVEEFNTDRATVGWIYSLGLAICFIVGIIYSPFVNKYGCRKVGIVASVIITTGITLSSLAPNIPVLFLTFSVITGTGQGGGVIVANTVVQQSFSRHRGLATTVLFLAYSTTILIGPPMMQYLLTHYGIFGAFLIQGGLSANGIPMAMIFDLKKKKESKPETIQDISEYPDTPATPQNGKQSEINQYKDLFDQMFDFSLLKIPAFLCLGLHYGLELFVVFGWFAQINSAAVFRGVSVAMAISLPVIMGSVSVVCRVVLGVLYNWFEMNPMILAAIGTLAFTASSILSSLAHSDTLFITGAVLAGFLEGLSITVVPLAVVHIVGVDRIAHGYALIQLGAVPGSLMGGSLTGWLYDISGDYFYPFLATAIGGLLSTVAALASLILARRSKSNIPGEREKTVK